ncbi:hypothetical protein [Mesorhizobium sp. 128a]
MTHFEVKVSITVVADSALAAMNIVGDKLRSYQTPLLKDEPIEKWTFVDAAAVESSWRDASRHQPPKTMPILVIDRHLSEAAELVRAVSWNDYRKQFIDYEGSDFPFTHWMPIPK